MLDGTYRFSKAGVEPLKVYTDVNLARLHQQRLEVNCLRGLRVMAYDHFENLIPEQVFEIFGWDAYMAIQLQGANWRIPENASVEDLIKLASKFGFTHCVLTETMMTTSASDRKPLISRAPVRRNIIR